MSKRADCALQRTIAALRLVKQFAESPFRIGVSFQLYRNDRTRGESAVKLGKNRALAKLSAPEFVGLRRLKFSTAKLFSTGIRGGKYTVAGICDGKSRAYSVIHATQFLNSTHLSSGGWLI
jgi:hypothetical protein